MITLVKSQISGIVPLIAGLEMAWYSNIGTNEAFQEPEMSAITELNEVNKSLQWILLSSNSPEMVSVCPLATAAPPSHPDQGRIFCKTFRSKICVKQKLCWTFWGFKSAHIRSISIPIWAQYSAPPPLSLTWSPVTALHSSVAPDWPQHSDRGGYGG